VLLLSRCKRFFTRPHLRLIALVGLIVPRRLRADWRQEWEAELRHRELLLAEWDRLDWRYKLDLGRRSASAFWDALWLQSRRLEDDLFQDLRYGVRMLVEQPGFTLIVVLTLGVGIGANSLIFSAVNAIIFRPLPYQAPEQVVLLLQTDPQSFARSQHSAFHFGQWREHTEAFQQVAATTAKSFLLTGAAEPELIPGLGVSADLFSMLGVPAALGRTFTTGDYDLNGPPVVIVSHQLWQRRFNGNPEVIGQSLTLNGQSYIAIGVMPPAFIFPPANLGAGQRLVKAAELWTPLRFSAGQLSDTMAFSYQVYARLKPGVTLRQAQAEIDTVALRIARERWTGMAERGATVVPLAEENVRKVRPTLILLLGAVGFILLIACVNVANLLLARAVTRQKEIAIRLALGASRLRIVRQLLTESVLLAVLGGAVGLSLTFWGLGFVSTLLASGISDARNQVSADWEVLGFTIVLSLFTGLVFGLAPALQTTQPTLNESLKEGGRSAASGRGGRRTRSGLVVIEVAFALVLLVGAGLMVRSILRLQDVDLGFDESHVLTLRIPPPLGQPSQQRSGFYRELLQRTAQLPGVRSAAIGNNHPLSGARGLRGITVQGHPARGFADITLASINAVSADYFQTLGIRLVQGRELTERDTEQASLVVVVNEHFARLFPGQQALGKHIREGRQEMTVVGVVADVKQQALDVADDLIQYVPFSQFQSMSPEYLILRTATDPLSLAGPVRTTVRTLSPNQPITEVRTMAEAVAGSIMQRRTLMLLLGCLAAIALVLAAAGIYGAISYSVSQRTHEIGLRMALGGQRGDVLKLIIRQGMGLATIGVALGVAGAAALTRFISAYLYGVTTTDPPTFAGVSVLLALVAVVASFIPARRATRVDPMIALRYE